MNLPNMKLPLNLNNLKLDLSALEDVATAKKLVFSLSGKKTLNDLSVDELAPIAQLVSKRTGLNLDISSGDAFVKSLGDMITKGSASGKLSEAQITQLSKVMQHAKESATNGDGLTLEQMLDPICEIALGCKFSTIKEFLAK